MNRSGFSLVQVLVFSAMLSTITLTLVALVTYSSQMINFIEAKINQNSLAQSVSDELHDTAICTAALQNQPFDIATATATVYPHTIPASAVISVNLSKVTDPMILAAGSILTNYNLEVVDVTFLNGALLDLGNNPSNPTVQTVYNVELWARLKVHKAGSPSPFLAPYKLASFAVYKHGAGGVNGVVDSCGPLLEFPMAACATAVASGPPQTTNPGIYMPGGYDSPTLGHVPPDGNGCVPLTAFNSQRPGAQGPTGFTGSSWPGPPGAPGPRGPRGTITYVPAGPAPKSDRRVKTVLGDFNLQMSDLSAKPELPHEAMQMLFIRTLQDQQQQLEKIRQRSEK